MTRPSRSVLVTGAAGGIGRALARHLRGRGFFVAGLDLVPPGDVDLPLVADIRDEGAVAAAVAEAEAASGGLGALVNNAATTDREHRPLHDLPIGEWERIFGVNVSGTVVVTRAVLGPMRRRRRGNLVFITSSLGQPRRAVAGDAAYSASKAALETLAFSLAQEVRADGINVNTLWPSVKVATGFFDRLSAAERAALAPPTLLDETAEFLVGLEPHTLTAASLSQHDWDHTPGYAASMRRAAEGDDDAWS